MRTIPESLSAGTLYVYYEAMKLREVLKDLVRNCGCAAGCKYCEKGEQVIAEWDTKFGGNKADKCLRD
jgi:hypothetical protein